MRRVLLLFAVLAAPLDAMALVQLGGQCTWNQDCVTGYCAYAQCGVGACLHGTCSLEATGAYCVAPVNCASNICTANVCIAIPLNGTCTGGDNACGPNDRCSQGYCCLGGDPLYGGYGTVCNATHNNPSDCCIDTGAQCTAVDGGNVCCIPGGHHCTFDFQCCSDVMLGYLGSYGGALCNGGVCTNCTPDNQKVAALNCCTGHSAPALAGGGNVCCSGLQGSCDHSKLLCCNSTDVPNTQPNGVLCAPPNLTGATFNECCLPAGKGNCGSNADCCYPNVCNLTTHKCQCS
jgi:hypothetical protein